MLNIQRFLRDGGSIDELTEKYAITAKRHPKYPNLTLLKYDQIDSPFSEEIVRECRGIILDENNNWDIVSFPFTKFFNSSEGHAAKIDWNSARVLEKLDGSLMTLASYNGEWFVSSSGTPDAGGNVSGFGFTFKELFWQTFKGELPPVDCGVCFCFELMSPFNRVVVRHEAPRLALIGARNLTTLKELTVQEANKFFPTIETVKEFPLTSLEACIDSLRDISPLSQEGYVVVDANFNRVKIKSLAYVALHHMKDGLSSNRALVEIVRNGEIDEVVANFSEYAPMLNKAKERLDTLVAELEACYEEIRDIPVQKDFAMIAIKSRCSSALFALRANKTTSIRKYFAECNIDSVMNLLGYKP